MYTGNYNYDRFSHPHYHREYLRGLRGKDRSKMLFALTQASVEFCHSAALFDIDIEPKIPAIEQFIMKHNEMIGALYNDYSKVIATFNEGINRLLAPYDHAFPVGIDHVAGLRWGGRLTSTDFIENARWRQMNACLHSIEKSLYAYKATLTQPAVKKVELSPEEKQEIVNKISSAKQLTSGETQTVNAAGEIEV